MRIFVTGGTGFVGGHFCEALRARSHKVVALARSTSDTAVLEKVGCEIVRAPLDDTPAVARAIQGCDVVCHLAAVTKALGWPEFRRVNVDGTSAVGAAAREAGFAGHFVLLSSLAAAGPSQGVRPRAESDPLRPVSYYGRSKLYSEKALAAAVAPERIVTLRPGGIYGPREHEIFEVVKQINKTGLALYTGPKSRVQLTHVDDIVSALVLAVENREMLGKAFHINDSDFYTMPQILSLLGAALGRSPRPVRLPTPLGWAAAGMIDLASQAARKPLAPFNSDKMRELCGGSWIADSSLLIQTTGWRPRWRLREGFEATIRWYRQNGWL